MTDIELTQELKEIEASIARNLNTLTSAQQNDCYCKAAYAQGYARGAGATVGESYFIWLDAITKAIFDFQKGHVSK